MFEKKIKEIPYKESKEFLDRQQNIDLLLVLVNLYSAQVGTVPNTDLSKKVITRLEETIDKLK